MIDFRGVSKRFGALVAVDRLTFAVGAGTVVGFLGPDGAGKATSLRVLLGLVPGQPRCVSRAVLAALC